MKFQVRKIDDLVWAWKQVQALKQQLIKDFKNGRLYELTFELVDQQSRETQKKYHAMLGDISRQALHLNQSLDLDSWKRLCVAQYRQDCIDNLSDNDRLKQYWLKREFRLIPSLDGKSLVALGEQTRKWPKYVSAGFIEWLLHYGAVNEIRWSDPETLSYQEMDYA